MKKKIIVTGCSGGIGSYVANELIKLDYEVYGLSRNQPRSSSNFNFVECDVSNPDSVKKVFSIFRRDTNVYGLINIAGIASMNLLISTPNETIKKIIETNLLGTIYCTKAIIPSLIRSKIGRIINFSSLAVNIGLKGESPYVASKGGVEAFSRSIARELSSSNITVNTISPGPIKTKLTEGVPISLVDKVIGNQIYEDQCSILDIYNCIKMILNKESQKITGQLFNIGGY